MTSLEKTTSRDSLAATFTTIQHSIEPRTRKMLLISSDPLTMQHALELLEGADVEIQTVSSGRKLWDLLSTTTSIA